MPSTTTIPSDDDATLLGIVLADIIRTTTKAKPCNDYVMSYEELCREWKERDRKSHYPHTHTLAYLKGVVELGSHAFRELSGGTAVMLMPHLRQSESQVVVLDVVESILISCGCGVPVGQIAGLYAARTFGSQIGGTLCDLIRWLKACDRFQVIKKESDDDNEPSVDDSLAMVVLVSSKRSRSRSRSSSPARDHSIVEAFVLILRDYTIQSGIPIQLLINAYNKSHRPIRRSLQDLKCLLAKDSRMIVQDRLKGGGGSGGDVILVSLCPSAVITEYRPSMLPRQLLLSSLSSSSKTTSPPPLVLSRTVAADQDVKDGFAILLREYGSTPVTLQFLMDHYSRRTGVCITQSPSELKSLLKSSKRFIVNDANGKGSQDPEFILITLASHVYANSAKKVIPEQAISNSSSIAPRKRRLALTASASATKVKVFHKDDAAHKNPSSIGVMAPIVVPSGVSMSQSTTSSIRSTSINDGKKTKKITTPVTLLNKVPNKVPNITLRGVIHLVLEDIIYRHGPVGPSGEYEMPLNNLYEEWHRRHSKTGGSYSMADFITIIRAAKTKFGEVIRQINDTFLLCICIVKTGLLLSATSSAVQTSTPPLTLSSLTSLTSSTSSPAVVGVAETPASSSSSSSQALGEGSLGKDAKYTDLVNCIHTMLLKRGSQIALDQIGNQIGSKYKFQGWIRGLESELRNDGRFVVVDTFVRGMGGPTSTAAKIVSLVSFGPSAAIATQIDQVVDYQKVLDRLVPILRDNGRPMALTALGPEYMRRYGVMVGGSLKNLGDQILKDRRRFSLANLWNPLVRDGPTGAAAKMVSLRSRSRSRSPSQPNRRRRIRSRSPIKRRQHSSRYSRSRSRERQRPHRHTRSRSRSRSLRSSSSVSMRIIKNSNTPIVTTQDSRDERSRSRSIPRNIGTSGSNTGDSKSARDNDSNESDALVWIALADIIRERSDCYEIHVAQLYKYWCWRVRDLRYQYTIEQLKEIIRRGHSLFDEVDRGRGRGLYIKLKPHLHQGESDLVVFGIIMDILADNGGRPVSVTNLVQGYTARTFGSRVPGNLNHLLEKLKSDSGRFRVASSTAARGSKLDSHLVTLVKDNCSRNCNMSDNGGSLPTVDLPSTGVSGESLAISTSTGILSSAALSFLSTIPIPPPSHHQ